MSASQPTSRPGTHYELHFSPLFRERRGYVFPCDSEGHVNMDALSDRARNNYLYARMGVGREFSVPAVQPAAGR
jgi:hypothetical protein